MHDQLELHLQRFQQEGETSNEEDDNDDLRQLLTLQSSAASSTNTPESLGKQVVESSSKPLKSEEQESNDANPEPLAPMHLEPHRTDLERKTDFPPTTNWSDRFFGMIRYLESQEPNFYAEVAIKILWVLPIMLLLGDHVGWIWSLQWTILGIVILHTKPDNSVEKKADHGDPGETINVVGTVEQKAKNKTIGEAISKVSHLLGLAGAPPLLLPFRLDQSSKTKDEDQFVVEARSDNVEMESNKNTINQRIDLDCGKAEANMSPSLSALVHLVESHVQFLLTIDQALDYLRISASIHLGLGGTSGAGSHGTQNSSKSAETTSEQYCE